MYLFVEKYLLNNIFIQDIGKITIKVKEGIVENVIFRKHQICKL